MNKNSDAIDFYGIRIPLEDLFSHTLVTGRSGAGKSRAAMRVLLRQLIALHAEDDQLKAGFICIDGKGSELRGYLEEALRACGRESDLVVIGPRDATYNPLQESWDDVRIANEIIAASAFFGGEAVSTKKNSDPFWTNAIAETMIALVGVARHLAANADGSQPNLVSDPLTLDHLVRLRPMLTKRDSEMHLLAAKLALAMQNDAGISLMEYSSLPTNTRQSVASSVGPILAAFGRPPLRDVLIPAPNRKNANLNSIIEKGKVILVDVGEANSALELLPAAALIKSAFAKMALSRKRQSINQERPIFAVLEEFQKVFTTQPESAACEANWMDACRWCRCGAILITQGISGLLAKASPALVDKTVSLCGTQIYLGTNDPATAAYAGRALGTHTRQSIHRTYSRDLPAPQLFPDDNEIAHIESQTLVPVSEPAVSAAILSTAPPGKMFISLRDGSTHTIQADLSAP